MLDFGLYTHLTFDCYGTLIDWESGILAALRRILERHEVVADDTTLLRLYARFEAEEETGPYRTYREIQGVVADRIAADLGFEATEEDLAELPDSIGQWPPFPDTVESLARLRRRFRLVVLSNIDDDLFLETGRTLGIEFDDIITAQQAGSYKPALHNFEFALGRLEVPVSQVAHVAQSLYHDHVPAKEMGFATVRVNRPSILRGTGLALPADVTPDLEVPNLWDLVELIGLDG
jgi:2-haloacid dehalogenase